MIKLTLSLIFAFFCVLSNASLTGRLFVVDSNWENRRYYITLCLLHDKTPDCEGFVINGSDLSVRSIYPVDSPYITNAAVSSERASRYEGCTVMTNQFCSFSVRHDRISHIKLK